MTFFTRTITASLRSNNLLAVAFNFSELKNLLYEYNECFYYHTY